MKDIRYININGKEVCYTTDDLKCMEASGIKVYYIPSNKFEDENAIIVGNTAFRKPKDDDKSFVYGNKVFKLSDDIEHKKFKGYIPILDNEYIAIDKKPKFILFFLLFLLCSIIIFSLFFIKSHDNIDKIIGGGYNISDDSDIRQSHSESGKVVVTGYDYLYLTDGDYLPLQCSAKNTQCMKFFVMDENSNTLYDSVVVEPGKEDRWYINKSLKEGDNKIIVKAYEVVDGNVLGNSVTYEMVINYY